MLSHVCLCVKCWFCTKFLRENSSGCYFFRVEHLHRYKQNYDDMSEPCWNMGIYTSVTFSSSLCEKLPCFFFFFFSIKNWNNVCLLSFWYWQICGSVLLQLCILDFLCFTIHNFITGLLTNWNPFFVLCVVLNYMLKGIDCARCKPGDRRI